MAWEIEHFKWKDFAHNPQNINRNGRPKKGIALVNQQLAEKGYDPVKKSEIEDNYLAMLQLERHELEALKDDITKPYLVNILAKNMLWERGYDIISSMLDRGIGKPAQKIDWEQKVDVSVTDERIKEMTAEELSDYLQSKMK